MKKNHFLLISFICLLSSSYAQETANEAKFVTDKIEIKGQVEKPVVLTLEQLKQMKVYEKTNYKITNHEGQVKKEIQSFKGVLLKDILEQAKVKMDKPKDRGKMYVVISASDGYQVIFAYNELFFNETGNQTFLAFEVEGKALTEEGKIALFSTGDTVTGPRHVKWVKSIEVKKL